MADEQKPRTQADFDRELAEIRLQKERLELRRLERDVQTLELSEEQQIARAKRNGKDLQSMIANSESRIGSCNHKKRGKDLAGLRGNGNSENYAVIKHQLPSAIIAVMCQRCPKIWLPPVPIHKKNFSQPRDYELALKKYKADLAEYQWALALPTENEMSTSGLFTGYTAEGVPFQEAALKEHHKTAAVPLME